MKSAGRPLLTVLRSRGYSAQAAAQKTEPRVSLPKQDVKVSRLPNGMFVASQENYSPVSRVSVVYNAGPRYEGADNVGVTHCIRNAASLSTQKSTGFAITKNIEHLGGSFSCTSTREHMVYNVECLRSGIDKAVHYLGHAATSPVFKTWEVDDVVPRIRLDLAILHDNPHIRLVEALHKAAFRSTLGNSLYTEPHRVGTHTPDMLKDYTDRMFVSNNMAVVGVGVDHDDLVAMAKNIPTRTFDAPPSDSAKYHGGEIRVDTTNQVVHAAVVTEGAAFTNQDVLTLAVLQKVMGGPPTIKYSSNMATSKIMKAAAGAASSPFAASCLNMSYSDSGLFGFQVAAQSTDVGGVLKAVAKAFSEATKGSISEADVQRAKNQLLASMHMELEDPSASLEDIGVQVMVSGQVISSADMQSAINKVTTADVQNIAKKVINGKPSMAVVGDLGRVPYLDELV